jgi:hypothetical protein
VIENTGVLSLRGAKRRGNLNDIFGSLMEIAAPPDCGRDGSQ